MSMGQGQTDTGTAPVTESSNEGQQQDQGSVSIEDSLASPFLDAIPEADREIVGRYVKHWDQNVQRKFQDIHNQYQPYKSLGEPDQLQQAMQIYQILDENPKQIYDILSEQFAETQTQQQVPQTQQSTQAPENDLFAELPDPIKNKFEQLDKHDRVLEMLAGWYLDQQKSQQEAQEDQALDNLLSDLRKRHGDFDTGDEEDFVLMKMQQGLDPDAAVQALRKVTQKQVNEAAQVTQNLPTVLSGGGAVAQQPVDVNRLSSKEVKSLVAQMLEQSSRANQ